MAEQISAIEQTRLITADVLSRYLPPQDGGTPAPMGGMRADDTMSTERELLYKVLFDMRADINDLKRMMSELMHNPQAPCGPVHDVKALLPTTAQSSASAYAPAAVYAESEDVTDEPPREMTKADMQREQIIRALRRNNGRAARPPPNCSCPNARSTARSRSWASKRIEWTCIACKFNRFYLCCHKNISLPFWVMPMKEKQRQSIRLSINWQAVK